MKKPKGKTLTNHNQTNKNVESDERNKEETNPPVNMIDGIRLEHAALQ